MLTECSMKKIRNPSTLYYVTEGAYSVYFDVDQKYI